jgi:hypothetical protein
MLNRLERVSQETHLPEQMRQYRPPPVPIIPTVGEPGIRDRDCPCSAFQYGTPSGTCWTDGHYMCKECGELDPKFEYDPEWGVCYSQGFVGQSARLPR